jgi:hypothetical protein
MYYGLINSMNRAVVPSYTARTTAFATATGITDTTILGALNTFDLGLISNSLDTKMKAVYPFVGGTASSHKYNFMNALDSNSAYRLLFSGGMTHSSNGVLLGGTNGFAETYIQPSSALSLNSTHVSVYSRTNNSSAVFDICASNPSNYSPDMAINYGGTTYFQVNQALSYSTYSDGSSSGMRIINRNSALNEKLFKNSILVATVTKSTSGLSTGNINLGRFHDGNIWSNRQYAFISVGDGLTDAEASTFYNLVQAMQTTLSRQV